MQISTSEANVILARRAYHTTSHRGSPTVTQPHARQRPGGHTSNKLYKTSLADTRAKSRDTHPKEENYEGGRRAREPYTAPRADACRPFQARKAMHDTVEGVAPTLPRSVESCRGSGGVGAT